MQQAIVEVSDVISVRVQMRPPKEGEIGWVVEVNCDAARALADVVANRDTLDVGAYGFGWVAEHDHPDFDTNARTGEVYGRNITVIVEPARTVIGKVVAAMKDKELKRELKRRLAFVVGALPDGMTFLDWYDSGAEMEVLTAEAGEDWVIESVSHSWGYIEGMAAAHNMTPLELLDDCGIPMTPPKGVS